MRHFVWAETAESIAIVVI